MENPLARSGPMALQQPSFLGANESGSGEDMVQDFVSMQMMSILQPFAESVRHLQAEVDNLLADAAKAQELMGGQAQRLDQHDQRLGALEASSAQAAEGLEKAQAEIGTLKKEKRSLEGNHEMTKAAVAKDRESIGTLTASLDSLQQALQDGVGRIGSVEVSFPQEIKRLEDYVEGRLNKQGKACKDMNERQAEMAAQVQKATVLAEHAGKSVSELVHVSEQQRKQDLGSVTNLGDLAASLESRLWDVNKQLSKHEDNFKATDRELQNLKTWTDSLSDVSTLSTKQEECAASVKEAMRRVDKAEEHICILREQTRPAAEEQAEQLALTEQRLAASIADLVQWRQTATAQYDALNSAGQRLVDLESGQSRLEARADATEGGLADTVRWRTDAARQLEVLKSEIAAQQSTARQLQELADGAGSGLHALRGELGADREKLAKMSSRIDMCCSYFNGLGKGLQDTSRQILSGDGGLLPPPKAGGTVLPAIPRARTPRAGVPSPRGGPSPRRAVENGLR